MSSSDVVDFKSVVKESVMLFGIHHSIPFGLSTCTDGNSYCSWHWGYTISLCSAIVRGARKHKVVLCH